MNNSLPPLFDSNDAFISTFTRRLQQLADSPEAGVFILVLANATTLPPLFRQILPGLIPAFEHLRQRLSGTTGDDRGSVSEDDLSVFDRLSNGDLSQLSLTRIKTLDHWQLQFNQLRSLRPARHSSVIVDELFQEFNASGFHFNKPFLDKEVLWQGLFGESRIKLLFNKFPFADYHGLLVFEPDQQRPQYLLHNQWLEVWKLILQLKHLNGWGMAYNSLGGFASVNHQHWQSFISSTPYPVESSIWLHNGGEQPYPLSIQVFTNETDAWTEIDTCQQHNTAFNLFLRPGKLYLVKRKKQGHYDHSEWTSGFAWSEVMGRFTATKEQDYLNITSGDLYRELSLLNLD